MKYLTTFLDFMNTISEAHLDREFESVVLNIPYFDDVIRRAGREPSVTGVYYKDRNR